MKFKAVVSSILLLSIGLLAGYLISTRKTTPANALRVALFQPAQHPAMDEINEAFKTVLKEALKRPVAFQLYNAQGNPTLMRGLSDEIIANNFDLIFTIGRACSEIVHNTMQKKESTTPLIFTAVEDPIKSGLIRSKEKPGLNASGIQEDHNYQAQLEQMLALKNDIQSITIVYDASRPEFIESYQQLEKICSEQNIRCHAIEILKPNELYEKISPVMNSTDLVMIFKDHTACMALDGLIKLCRQYHVTLYASDLNSCCKGAVAAYGVNEADYGTLAGKKAVEILQEKTSASTLPVSPITDFYLQVNKKELTDQNLPLNKHTLFMMEYGNVCC